MRLISYIFILIIIFFGVTFAVLNSAPVIFDYYFNKHTLPLSLLLVLAFALGCLIGLLANALLLFNTKLTVYGLRKRLLLAEKEIENLRAIPLQDKV